MKERMEALTRCLLFSDFNEGELRRVAEEISAIRYRPEATLFHQGEMARKLYIIKSGMVKTFVADTEGNEIIVGVYASGQVLGTGAVFQNGVFNTSASPLTPAEVYILDGETFSQLLKEHPEMAMKVIRTLSERLSHVLVRISQLSIQNAYQRVASILLGLAAEYGEETTEGIRITLPLHRQELADMAALSRETVSRALGRLRKEGLVTLSGKSISITHLRRLRLWAEL